MGLDIQQWILWLALWEAIPALIQILIAFGVAWLMLGGLDWILDKIAQHKGG